MTGLGVYRQLLANQPLTKLLVGQFISGIGDWLYIVAIFVLIYRETGDAALVGLFGAARVIPYVLLSVRRGSSPTGSTAAWCSSSRISGAGR